MKISSHCSRILFFIILLNPVSAVSEQFYSLEGNPVLLYKIINWWYHAAPEDIAEPCGLPVKCVAREEIALSFNEQSNMLTVAAGKSFADLFSLAGKECNGVAQNAQIITSGPYAGKEAIVSFQEEEILNTLTIVIKQFTTPEYTSLKREEAHLEISFEGRVKGLANGKVALSPNVEMLYACPQGVAMNSSMEDEAIVDLYDSVSGVSILRFRMPAATCEAGTSSVP